MSERRGGAGDPYGALSYILAGPLLYGGLGWVADHLLGTILFLPLGIVGGLALSIFIIVKRFGTPERSAEPND
jgi:F0F1-type ATP synthase assembly protein I